MIEEGGDKMPKKTKEQWGNWVKINNAIGRSFLKAFPKASPKLKAQWKPIKLSDYKWDNVEQEYIKRS
jgi:hypothetical protein